MENRQGTAQEMEKETASQEKTANQEKTENQEKTVNQNKTVNQEKTANQNKTPQEQAFDQELERLMAPEPEGNKGKTKKNKKKKKTSSMVQNQTRKGRKSWSKKRRVITVLGAAAIVFFAWKTMSGGKEAPPPMVPSMVLEAGSVQNRLTMNGPISGTDSVDVVSNLHAEVLELKVKEGDRVEKDQLLAVVDSDDLLKEVEIAQNAYDLAVANRNERQREEQNGYTKAIQDCQAAKAALDRTAVLVQAGSEPPVNLENAQNAYADAVRAVASYRVVNGRATAGESYDLQIKNAAFELEKRQEALENALIKSPIAGTVTRVNTKVGQFADKPEDDRPMFIIENLDQLEQEIKVSEYSIGKVAIGQPVTIHADILNGKTVKGRVASISPTGEEKGNGSSERVIPTIVEILEKDSGLIAGITARAEIILEEADNALVAPVSALLQKEDGSVCVQKIENNIIHEVPVEIGVEGDVSAELIPIEEGSLQIGDTIAITASPALTDGMAVMPQTMGGM